VPVLMCGYVALMRRRNKDALRYSSIAELRDATGSRLLATRHAPAVLLLLSISALLIASARPAIVLARADSDSMVIFAIDVSYSMAARDVAPTRLAAAQAMIKSLLGRLPRSARIGVVAFAQYADLVQPPTLRHQEVVAAVEGLRFGYGSGLGTGIAAALATISPEIEFGYNYDMFGPGRSPVADDDQARPLLTSLRDPSRGRSAAVVVLTDGASSSGMPAPVAAQIAAANGVSIFPIGVGRSGGIPVMLEKWRFHAEFSPDVLEQIARTARGAYFHIGDKDALKTLRGRLQAALGTQRTEEITAVFAGLAAVLLLASGFSSLGHSRI